MIGVALGQPQVPKDVQAIVDNYLKDTSCSMCFSEYNKSFYRLDPTLKLSDVQVGTPIQVFKIDTDKLMQNGVSIPISKVIFPTTFWEVPINALGKTLYTIKICSNEGPFLICGMGVGLSKDLDRAQETWLKNIPYAPIIIDAGPNLFLHFPQIDDYNLLLLRQGYKFADSVAIAFDISTGDNNPAYASPGIKKGQFNKSNLPKNVYLSDSRRIFKHFIKRAIKNSPEKFEKYRGNNIEK